jgi:hypothetical protein
MGRNRNLSPAAAVGASVELYCAMCVSSLDFRRRFSSHSMPIAKQQNNNAYLTQKLHYN